MNNKILMVETWVQGYMSNYAFAVDDTTEHRVIDFIKKEIGVEAYSQGIVSKYTIARYLKMAKATDFNDKGFYFALDELDMVVTGAFEELL